MTDCYLIVYHSNIYDPVGAVELPCYPEEISESQEAMWQEQSILGRSSPLVAYTGTGFRSINISFDMHREMENGTHRIEDVISIMRKSLYPEYLELGLIPPTTMIALGEFMVRGVVRSVGFTWKKPIIDEEYQVCTASVSIIDVPESVFGASNIRAIPTNPFGISDPRPYSWRGRY